MLVHIVSIFRFSNVIHALSVVCASRKGECKSCAQIAYLVPKSGVRLTVGCLSVKDELSDDATKVGAMMTCKIYSALIRS